MSWSFLREKVRFDSWSLPYWMAVGLGALAYFGLAELGLSYATLHEAVSPVWPASGLAVALIRLFGLRLFPSIFIGALAANALVVDPQAALLIAIGYTLEGVAGGMILNWLVGRYGENFVLARVLGIVLAALWATLVGTAVGIAALYFSGLISAPLLGNAWFTWWVGDAVGILIVTPALFALRSRYANRPAVPATVARAGALALAMAAVLVLSDSSGDAGVAIFLAFPIVLLAGHWFGLRGAAWSVVTVAVALTAMTASGAGIFSDATLNDDLINMQAFLAVLAIVSLMFADLKPLDLKLPATVLLVGAAVAAVTFEFQRRESANVGNLRFEQLIQTASDRVRERMTIYTNALRAGASMYLASDRVTRKEWHDFTTSLSMTERYPGIRGLGVVVPVEPLHLQEFLTWERFDGAPNLALKMVPDAANPRAPEDEHFIVLYLEPAETAARAIGLDLSSEAVRRAAAISARDTGLPAITSRITLIHDPERKSSFLLFFPAYHGLGTPATVEERRARFRGWIFAPFVTQDFFRSSLLDLADKIQVEIFEGDSTDSKDFLLSTLAAGETDITDSGWRNMTTLTLVGRDFTVRWHTGPGFVPESRRHVVLSSCAIVLLALMLAALIANLQSLRVRANAIAVEMTTALAASNERLHAAISVMEDGFGLFDADDRIVLYNDAFMDEGSRKVFGNDVTGRKFEEIVRAFVYHDMPLADPPFDREAWIAQRMERHRNPPELPIEVQWSGGRWMRISERRTSDGGYVGIWSDVTEIKLAEQRLLTAIDAMDSGFALFDADDRLQIHNEGFVDQSVNKNFGGDARGRTFEEIIRAFANSEVTAVGALIGREEWVKRRVEQHRNPTGEPFEQQLTDGQWVRVSERRTADGGYVGTWTDITELKRVEARLRDAIESINEGFALIDSEMRYVVVNSRLQQLYPVSGHLAKPGATLEEVLRYGAEHGEYPGVAGQEQVDVFVRLWMSAFTSADAFVGETDLGDNRWLMVSHHPTSSGGYVSIRTDITAQKQREAELGVAKEDLEARSGELMLLAAELETARRAADMANLGKSQFLANMAHELRTPLNAISGFSELILSEQLGPIQPAKYRDHLEFIHQGGKHLLSLINDILDLSKVEAGKMELRVEALPAEQVAYSAMNGVWTMAEERGVELKTEIPTDCPILHADPRSIRQILLNLLSNAVKFTPNAGSVTVAMKRRDEGVDVSVADTGVGMTRVETVRALEIYGQVESDLTKKHQGTGLGLPLVKSLAELHGGSLSLASEKGKGTTVTVFLPWHGGLPQHLG